MTAGEGSPASDAELVELLRQNGIVLELDDLEALLDGVLAAPEGEDSLAWTALVSENPSPELVRVFQDLKARRRSAGSKKRPPIAERLAGVRAAMAERELDGFFVPRADEHQGEYVPKRADRLAWLTGFTGSAGIALVLEEAAAIFSDGRYTLQLEQQVDGAHFERLHVTEQPPAEWLLEKLPNGGRVGYDTMLHTPTQVEALIQALAPGGIELVPLDDNLVDHAWSAQPPAPLSPAIPHPLEFAGRSSEDKRAALADDLAKRGAEAAVLTLPDSIAWLLNLRGADVPRTPFCLSFAVLHADGALDWFVDKRKVTPALARTLGNSVRLQDPDALGAALDGLGARGAKVLADPGSAGIWFFRRLAAAGAKLLYAPDPCQLAKACKNPVEVAGTKRTHERDAVPLIRFLAWLDREACARADSGNPITEMEAADKLHGLRRETGKLRDLSFDTISSVGPNGALNHYRVTEETNRPLTRGEFYLVDSGGQYSDGTTDVTRTLPIGEVSVEMAERYTLVLKGHLALGRQRFPKGTTGSQIDALARQYLWQAGLDFDHGTGHGVGSFLSVHEGPQRISKVPNSIALQPGMIVSNEPGYYKPGAYGIRIENLEVVEEIDLPGRERPLLGFHTLTLAPYDRRVIRLDLLTGEEQAQIDAYHARVFATVGQHLDEADRTWLAAATQPLA
ncbi:aminopeptidase P family protein [Limibacillus halophilus]|uniref:Xaa-Pro aminopeptidase n=1 Tax=Limibacillus halophilus TaxID=1579333 RepID=A0A839SSA3_9PROT|nr:aminopeptidase P family protein [Limibacillus halophilus]MBB3064859.1 Xaa-Pro aminopeptidase [Limibacillus halophilus]